MSAYCATKTQSLKRIATYTNEEKEGHNELRDAIGLEIAWNCHGEVLLRHVLCRGGWGELGVEGTLVEDAAEFTAWGGAATLGGTIKQGDHNRNILRALYAVLPVCILF